MKTLVFTGHRPPRLGLGYNTETDEYKPLKDSIKEYIVNGKFTDVWSGMALGTDTVAALVAIELKSEGYNIKLHCAIPCRDYDDKWINDSKRTFNKILDNADEVVYVTDGPYDIFCLSKRNFFMIDKADEVYAVWDEKAHGGTYEAISYAKYKEIPIFINKVIVQ